MVPCGIVGMGELERGYGGCVLCECVGLWGVCVTMCWG